MTRSRWVVAALVGVLTGAVVVWVVTGGHGHADVVPVVAAMVGYVWLIVTDSARRGRSGAGWLLACIFLAPLALPVFLFHAVSDRLRGRRGIEGYWAPGVRWCYLTAIVMAGVALGLGVVQVEVARVAIPAAPAGQYPSISSGTIGRSCEGNALALSLGERPAAVIGYPENLPAAQQAALNRFEQRCVATAGRRVVAGEVALAGALAMAFVGAANGRRRRPVSPPPAPVTLAA